MPMDAVTPSVTVGLVRQKCAYSIDPKIELDFWKSTMCRFKKVKRRASNRTHGALGLPKRRLCSVSVKNG